MLQELVTARGLTWGELTLSECVSLATQANLLLSDVVIEEAMHTENITREAVLDAVLKAFSHNLTAVEAGVTTGESSIMGCVGKELSQENAPVLLDDALLNKILTYTFAAQIGNHCVGLEPCAGTGDSCPYTGFLRATLEAGIEQERVLRAAAVMLKIGTMFRVGKRSTGCNMEGFGAGSAACAAGFVELAQGTPEQLEKAVVLAISPTVANPCTPRVMVPGLCATHIGTAVLNGRLAASLALHTSLPVNVSADVMMAMAASVHMVSAKTITPTVITYMEPFFKTNEDVERYISPEEKAAEEKRIAAIVQTAGEESRALAKQANSIVKPFGMAVVGGSSQAVGSPTNAGRLAHALVTDKTDIQKITIELYPELFARRGINVPGILMGAIFGSKTSDATMYRDIMEKVIELGIQVEIIPVEEAQVQKVTIETKENSYMVKTLNRGGARLVIVDASCGVEKAQEFAKQLGIELAT